MHFLYCRIWWSIFSLVIHRTVNPASGLFDLTREKKGAAFIVLYFLTRTIACIRDKGSNLVIYRSPKTPPRALTATTPAAMLPPSPHRDARSILLPTPRLIWRASTTHPRLIRKKGISPIIDSNLEAHRRLWPCESQRKYSTYPHFHCPNVCPPTSATVRLVDDSRTLFLLTCCLIKENIEPIYIADT